MKKIIARHIDGDVDLVADGLHPLLKKIYLARGIVSGEELELSLQTLLPFDGLLGIDVAVSCLCDALHEQQRILIIGDFDVDGATSTALTIRALRSFGFQNVSYLVPSRFEFGYGLTPEIVAVAALENPDVIITVDNGINSLDGVNAANKIGIRVLVTDHHLPGAQLPDAVAIVNPNQPHDKFPSKNLAGVGVAFYLMLALRSRLREDGLFERLKIDEPNMGRLLNLVALGTVADVVTMDKNNRILVQHGLTRIRNGSCCVGIKALLDINGRSYERIVASDLGFVLGPRLNAAGRLDDMSLGIECLLTDDYSSAYEIAQRLNALNDERKAIERDMQHQVSSDLEQLKLSENLPIGLCLFDESWHRGVVGILASRIKDKVHRPVIAFAKIGDDEIKGSARSIPDVHIRNVLEAISLKYPGLITKYGGHAMAAGLSMPLANYQNFCQAFVDEVNQRLDADDLCGEIVTDGELAREFFNLEVAAMLRFAGPWGQGFPEPLFEGVFTISGQKLVSNRHLKLELNVPESQFRVSAIVFNIDLEQWPNYRCEEVKVVYRLDINEFRGHRNLQLIVEHIQPFSRNTTYKL